MTKNPITEDRFMELFDDRFVELFDKRFVELFDKRFFENWRKICVPAIENLIDLKINQRFDQFQDYITKWMDDKFTILDASIREIHDFREEQVFMSRSMLRHDDKLATHEQRIKALKAICH